MRPYRAFLLLIAPLMLGACNEDAPAAPAIINAYFAPSLGVDPTQMTKTDDGLYYRDDLVGTGIVAAKGDSAYVYYSGYLANGTKFDGTVQGAPYATDVGSGDVIVGFDEGVTGMRVGGKRTIIIPPELGYGEQPQTRIPPNSILVFTLQIVNVKRN